MGDPSAASEGSETAAAPGVTGWSQEYDSDGESDDLAVESDRRRRPSVVRESWSTTWGRAAALLMAGVALAGAIVFGHWAWTRPLTQRAASPASEAPSTRSVAASPPSIASTPDQDDKYVQALQDRGISFSNPSVAVHNGKVVCENIRAGMSVSQIVADFRQANPAWAKSADAYVATSVRTYCPQNASLLPPGS